MKETFFCRLLNDHFSDPTLFIRFKREKKAFLFDSGDISSLSMKDFQKITHVFITHMHIDHFIGFDYLLRCLLNRERPLYVYGPAGIIKAIEGKLKGYTWNLIRGYPLMIEVYEIRKKTRIHCSFYASEGFRKINRKKERRGKNIFSDIGIFVEADIFNHSIPVLGFTLKEDFHINIDKSLLLKKGLPVGPWLTELKSAMRINDNKKKMNINGKVYSIDELRDLALITMGQQITYITDISPEEKNIKRAIELSRGSDTLYIEAFFLNRDKDRAIGRNHLTAKLAGVIAREAGVNNLELIHISPKYISSPELVIEEAAGEFRRSY